MLDDLKSLRFGSVQVVPARREVLLRGAPVALGSRAFDLLMALLKRNGRLSSKDELMAEVWGGTIVDGNNLPAQIAVLRKVLAADPEFSRCLQTIPGRGYRFSVDVVSEPAAATPISLANEERPLSLAVLPFASLSSDVGQAYFAQGMSETVATDLSRIAGLLVVFASTAVGAEER